MNQIPIKLDRADVLYFTGNKKANHYGYIHYDDHKENITALAISTYGHNDYYLFSCDINWNVIGDTLHHSVEEAMDCASISHHFNNIWNCKSGGLVFKSDNNVIELFYDYTYSLNSNDNLINYSQIYKSDDYNSHCSKYGLKLSQKNKILKSILLIAGSFDAPVNTDNVIIDGKHLLISVCDTLFCLNTLNLSLVWKVKVDDSICFKIYSFDQFYITHGEMVIKRINKKGRIDWEYYGADIFVSPDDDNNLIFEKDKIIVKDFEENVYCLDFNGNTLKFIKNNKLLY